MHPILFDLVGWNCWNKVLSRPGLSEELAGQILGVETLSYSSWERLWHVRAEPMFCLTRCFEMVKGYQARYPHPQSIIIGCLHSLRHMSFLIWSLLPNIICHMCYCYQDEKTGSEKVDGSPRHNWEVTGGIPVFKAKKLDSRMHTPNCYANCSLLFVGTSLGGTGQRTAPSSGANEEPPTVTTALLKYNPYAIQFIYVKCTIQWFWVSSQICRSSITVYFATFSSSQKETL